MLGGRDRPSDALIEKAVVEGHSPIFIDGEWRVGVGKQPAPLGEHPIAVGSAQRRRQAHVKDLRRILTHHRCGESGAPLGRVGGGIAGIDTAQCFGDEPKQRCAIVGLERAGRGVNLLDGRERRRAAEHHDGEPGGIRLEIALASFAVDGARGERRAAQLLEHGLDTIEGTAG